MSPCADREPMLQALLDGELDAANTLSLEAHLKTCPGCAAHLRTLQAVRERLAEAQLAEPAPEALRRRIAIALDQEDRAAAPRRRPWWASLAAAWSAAGVMTAATAVLGLMLLAPAADTLEAQLVADHVRSLQAAHLVDVGASDRHVVRPWFNGKIDFAPPAPDLADQGFPMVGGRLDYADGRTVAALVYRRRAHLINLFVLPERRGGLRLPWAAPKPPPGYRVVTWRDGGLEFWAVSDVEGGDLATFRQAFRQHAGR